MNEKQLHALAAKFAKNLKTPEDLNQFSRILKKITVEAALNAELTDHLGNEKHQPRKGKNTRNGYTSKTVICDEGEVDIDTPRDRDGTFEPGKVISGANKGLNAAGETMAASMVTDEMITLGTAADLELSSVLSRLGEKAVTSIKWSDTSVKFAVTNAVAASTVKSISEVQEYASGKSVTSDNLLNSAKDITWSGGNAFVTTGVSLPVAVAISVASDQVKDGKGDPAKSFSSSILGEIIDRYLGRGSVSPYFRESVTQTYENEYEKIKDTYKNDKK